MRHDSLDGKLARLICAGALVITIPKVSPLGPMDDAQMNYEIRSNEKNGRRIVRYYEWMEKKFALNNSANEQMEEKFCKGAKL